MIFCAFRSTRWQIVKDGVFRRVVERSVRYVCMNHSVCTQRIYSQFVEDIARFYNVRDSQGVLNGSIVPPVQQQMFRVHTIVTDALLGDDYRQLQ